jgi:hypothetical protein
MEPAAGQVAGEWSGAWYAGKAAWLKEIAELRETQHRMKHAQDWLSTINSCRSA